MGIKQRLRLTSLDKRIKKRKGSSYYLLSLGTQRKEKTKLNIKNAQSNCFHFVLWFIRFDIGSALSPTDSNTLDECK